MEGKIINIISNRYSIFNDGVIYNVISKGIFKFKKQNILVGDNVVFNDEELIIDFVNNRKNELIRPRVANIDQLLILMSTKEPEISQYLIYKYLSYANYYHIPSVVILTKVDMLNDRKEIETIKKELENINVKCILHSKKTHEGLDEIKNILKDKTSILMGQTGVGKSSLINELDESFNQEIGTYSIALGRGKHQTKEITLFPYMNGFIGDTPGFSSLELNFYKEDLASCFPGFHKENCYYSDCLHLNEKDCEIKRDIEKNIISNNQYEIYKRLLNELISVKEKYK